MSTFLDGSRFPAKAVHAAGAVGCALVLGVGFFAGGRTFIEGDASPVDLTDQLHQAESGAALKAAAVERLEREVTHAQQQVDDKPMSLLPATVVNQRLAALSRMAQDCDLTLASSQQGQETQLAYYAFVPIHVGGDGRLVDFVRFLGALHEGFPDMGVGTFDISRDPLGGGRFSLTLNWYVQPSRTAEAS